MSSPVRVFAVLTLLSTLGASLPSAAADTDDRPIQTVLAPVPVIDPRDPCTSPQPSAFSFQLGTGIDANENVLPQGTVDPAWTLSSRPLSMFGGAGPGIARVAEVYPGWTPYTFWPYHAAWITSAPSGEIDFSGTYVYEREFYVSPRAQNVHLDVVYAADDGVTLSLVQPGGAATLLLADTPSNAFAQWQSAPDQALANAGQFVLVAKVTNIPMGGMPDENPTGLQLGVSLAGDCAPLIRPANPDPCQPFPVSFYVELGTGRDFNGAPLPGGQMDPFWQADSYPKGGATIAGAAYSHGVDPAPGTLAPNPTLETSWINPNPVGLEGDFGNYQYSRLLDVPQGSYNDQLSISFAAAGQPYFFLLVPMGGGTPIQIPAGAGNYWSWTSLGPVSVSPGLYRLEAHVGYNEYGPFVGLDASVVLTGTCSGSTTLVPSQQVGPTPEIGPLVTPEVPGVCVPLPPVGVPGGVVPAPPPIICLGSIPAQQLTPPIPPQSFVTPPIVIP